mmetsp:Transcript_80315/g.236256  ORF Transcript_80315/g.236256 Transcript_80315/m.236256 type:complete len:207 (+) Transcript_80315:315-935(+)
MASTRAASPGASPGLRAPPTAARPLAQQLRDAASHLMAPVRWWHLGAQPRQPSPSRRWIAARQRAPVMEPLAPHPDPLHQCARCQCRPDPAQGHHLLWPPHPRPQHLPPRLAMRGAVRSERPMAPLQPRKRRGCRPPRARVRHRPLAVQSAGLGGKRVWSAPALDHHRAPLAIPRMTRWQPLSAPVARVAPPWVMAQGNDQGERCL